MPENQTHTTETTEQQPLVRPAVDEGCWNVFLNTACSERHGPAIDHPVIACLVAATCCAMLTGGASASVAYCAGAPVVTPGWIGGATGAGVGGTTGGCCAFWSNVAAHRRSSADNSTPTSDVTQGVMGQRSDVVGP